MYRQLAPLLAASPVAQEEEYASKSSPQRFHRCASYRIRRPRRPDQAFCLAEAGCQVHQTLLTLAAPAERVARISVLSSSVRSLIESLLRKRWSAAHSESVCSSEDARSALNIGSKNGS